MHNLLGPILSWGGGRGGVRFMNTILKQTWWFDVCFLYCCVPSQNQDLNWRSFSKSSQLTQRSSDISGPVKKRKRKKSLFARLSAEFWLTMWMKSTGVAVYKSQCSLSRMILSMRRISAVEKLHPLCITRSLTEPITCSNRHQQREANKHTVLN